MKGCAGGCLGRTAALIMLAVLMAAAWRYGPGLADRVSHHFDEEDGAPVAASPELADATLGRFESVLEGRRSRASFTGAEVESVLRYRLNADLPSGVTVSAIRFRGGEVILALAVAVELLPEIPELERMRGVLPDRLPVEFRGTLLTLADGQGAFLVRRVDLAGIPLPRGAQGRILEELQPTRGAGLPPESISFPLPPGVQSLYIDDDMLVVARDP